MKRSSPLWGSVSVLIGVVIAVLALVRGAWLVPLLLLVFTAWGLWVVMFQLQPAWDSIRGYRKKEHDARKQREASLYSTAQTNADAMQLLLRHVNHRISAYLKSVYPSARWEWTTGNPTALVIQGGTGRIRVYGIEEYDYADVQIDRNGNLSCNLLKVVPVQPCMDAPTPPNQQPVDPQVWYDVEGREVLERVIADLDSRGHSSLTLKEDGSVCIHEDDETVVLLSHKKPDGHINVKVEFGEGEGKVPLDNIAKRAEEYKPKERVTYKMIKEYIEAKYGFKVHTAYIAEVKRDLGLPMYDAPNAVEELKQPRKHPTAEKVEAIRDALKHFEVI